MGERYLAGSYPAERLGIDNTPSERAVERLPLAVKSKPLGGAEILAGRT